MLSFIKNKQLIVRILYYLFRAILQHVNYHPPCVIRRTAKPFHTTNLVIFAPENVSDTSEDCSFVSQGDALIVDPGCRHKYHEELKHIVACLPKKLIVFVTHHHRDHVEGLSIIQKCNPNAMLLAHENTMRRIGKGDWSLGFTLISGEEDILDIQMATWHCWMLVLTHSLWVIIVWDMHIGIGEISVCVCLLWWKESQGSAALDITSGGNMTKNRKSREESILKAIENGAETTFDIVANVYSGVDRSFWITAASNVGLHVDHLAQQKKLPEGFSVENFSDSLVTFESIVG
ncbi:hypothetical protein CRYUN_Cryun06bG0106800 [Craigia yunnanensis]